MKQFWLWQVHFILKLVPLKLIVLVLRSIFESERGVVFHLRRRRKQQNCFYSLQIEIVLLGESDLYNKRY